MSKKLIFMDLDGTIIDHKTNTILESTKRVIKNLQTNGHTVVIATGRPPCLFYDIDKTLNIDTYIAANGRYVKHQDKVLLNDALNPEIVNLFVEEMAQKGYDVGFETADKYVVNTISNDFVEKFSNHFHLPLPEVIENFHLSNDILQMILFTDDDNQIEYLKNRYPELDFNISCPYGIDINAVGGMKEVGVKLLTKYLGFPIKDTIAIGDGHNDIGMLEHANVGIAMGNAPKAVKDIADYTTKDSHQDGIEYILKKLKLV